MKKAVYKKLFAVALAASMACSVIPHASAAERPAVVYKGEMTPHHGRLECKKCSLPSLLTEGPPLSVSAFVLTAAMNTT